MQVNPPESAAVQSGGLEQMQDLIVRCRRGVRQGGQKAEDLLTAAEIPAGQFSDDERVAEDLMVMQEFRQASAARAQVGDPD